MRKRKSIPWREGAKQEIAKYTEPGYMLRGCRFKMELTQEELADELHLSLYQIRQMEYGRLPITLSMAKKLAKFFKTTYRLFLV